MQCYAMLCHARMLTQMRRYADHLPMQSQCQTQMAQTPQSRNTANCRTDSAIVQVIPPLVDAR